jgi:hypothetical protein
VKTIERKEGKHRKKALEEETLATKVDFSIEQCKEIFMNIFDEDCGYESNNIDEDIYVDNVDNDTEDGDYVDNNVNRRDTSINMDGDDIDNGSYHREQDVQPNDHSLSNYRHRSFAIKDILNYDDDSELEVKDDNENDVYGRYYIAIDSTTSGCYI